MNDRETLITDFLKSIRKKFKTVPSTVNSKNNNHTAPPNSTDLKNIIMDSIPTVEDKNTLIFGSAGSGKSHVLTNLVQQYLKLNKKIFLFGAVRLGKAYPESGQSSYFDLESSLLDKFKAELLITPYSNFDLPRNFREKEYDVIIIDDLGLLSYKSLNELLQILQNRPKTKFVLAIQSPDTKYKEIIQYFDELYLGYYDFTTHPKLSELLGIEEDKINICASDYFAMHQKFLKVK